MSFRHIANSHRPSRPYISFYNHDRLQKRLNGLSPVE
ncbi:IS3 family transposase [Exiguobacterium sp. s43]